MASMTGWGVSCTPNQLQGTAVLCFISSSMASMEGVYQHAIDGYKVVAFLEQLISWAASEIHCADKSDELATAEINSLDQSIYSTAPEINREDNSS